VLDRDRPRDHLAERRAAARSVAARAPSSARVGETLSPILVTAVEAQRSAPIDQPDNVVLNACRTLRYAEDRRWYSKVEAGRRTAASPDAFTPLIRAALETHVAGRRAGQRLVAVDVRRYLDHVLDMLRRGLDRSTVNARHRAADAR
jgi:hypothetical protein